MGGLYSLAPEGLGALVLVLLQDAHVVAILLELAEQQIHLNLEEGVGVVFFVDGVQALGLQFILEQRREFLCLLLEVLHTPPLQAPHSHCVPLCGRLFLVKRPTTTQQFLPEEH